jgi:hypothetical protein
MEIVEIAIEFPSGMVITDRATYFPDLNQVQPSDRLITVLHDLSQSEAPPSVTVSIGGVGFPADQRLDGGYDVDVGDFRDSVERRGLVRRLLGHDWTKDQRQQFGRFCHALTVVSVAGAVGIFHATKAWTLSELLNEAVLILVVVVTYFQGMNSMNGD